MIPAAEWLETDGLGGYAMGRADGVRTRRYHALLVAATRPPTGRLVLVNGLDAFVECTRGRIAISAQRYAPDVTSPDGVDRLASFAHEPWPTWTYRLPNGARIVQELVMLHGAPLVALRWRLTAARGAAENAEDSPRHSERTRGTPVSRLSGDGRDIGIPPSGRSDDVQVSAGSAAPRESDTHDVRLVVRPFVSGRDAHGEHHENPSFAFDARTTGDAVVWRPYADVPEIVARSNGVYTHAPEWYRNFQYDEERARGLGFVEDLATPGTFTFDLTTGPAVLVLGAAVEARDAVGGSALDRWQHVADVERERRSRFASGLHRAADAYVVRRGSGKTIVAGYPWFSDWGRDTFIALRGLCIAGRRLDDARDILLEWSRHVSEGMLPNYFPDGDQPAEYNSVDASLWYCVAVHDYLQAVGARADRDVETALRDAVEAIVAGYARGTRYGIRADGTGLLCAGEPGVQLTWMDARVDGREITPRIGKPVEIQALWINALRVAGARRPHWAALAEHAQASFSELFWDEVGGGLFDVVDVNHVRDAYDASCRPNQILAVGGLPWPVVDAERARRTVDRVERELWTPAGLRSLARGEPAYVGRYAGDMRARDGAYHQGTVWPWLIGAFVDAWVRVRGASAEAKHEARERFLLPLLAHYERSAPGHVGEVADAEPPFTPGGCPFQAWSVGEALRVAESILRIDAELPAGPSDAQRRRGRAARPEPTA